MDKTTSLKLAEAICEDLNLWGPNADKNTEKMQRIAAILRDDVTEKPRTERERTHCEVAAMARGQLIHVAAYLRTVADGLERGSRSGMTGCANPAEGRWLSDLP